jgi:hypothetical protein
MTATAGLSIPFFIGTSEADLPEYVGEPDFELWTGDDVSALWTDSPKLTGDGGAYDPVTMAGPLSYRGGESAHVRLRDVRDDGFEIKAEEWKDQYGHTPEKTHAIHLDRGVSDAEGGNVWDINRVQCEDDDWSNFYLNGYHSVPRSDFAVLATIQTHNGGDSVVPRIKPNGSSGWKIKMQEEKGSNGNHYQETVGVMAVEKGQDTVQGRNYEAGTWTWPDGALGWRTIEFDGSYSGTTPPLFLASIQTFNGSEPCNLRYRNLTANSVEVKLEESPDSYRGHLDEEIGYLVMESPYISPGETYKNGAINQVDYNAEELTNSRVLLSSELVTHGGYDTNDSWEYEFDIQGQGACRYYDEGETPEQGWKKDKIHEHYIEIYDSSGSGDIETSGAADRIGGHPAPKFTALEIGQNIVGSLATTALSRADKYVEGLIAASDVYDTLKNGYDKNASDTSGENKKFTWRYSDWDSIGDKHSDVMHHLRFDYDVDYGTSAVFHVDQDVQAQGEQVGLTATTNWDIEVGSPNPDTLSSASTDGIETYDRSPVRPPRPPEVPEEPIPGGAESLSKKERETFGVELKKKRVLESAGFKIPDKAITEGDLVWYTSNPPINIVERQNSGGDSTKF